MNSKLNSEIYPEQKSDFNFTQYVFKKYLQALKGKRKNVFNIINYRPSSNYH